jgi:hypothetical protein
VDFINAIMSAIGGALMAPFRALPPLLTLAVWSVVAGIAGMFLYRAVSNQNALKRVNSRMKADLLAMKLFKDEISVTFSCQWDLLKVTGMKFWYALFPLLVMMVPFVLAMSQLGTFYEFRPLAAGEPAVVSLFLSDAAWDANRNAILDVPAGVRVETPQPIRDAGQKVVRWRISPTAHGQYVLAWNVNGERVEKSLSAGEDLMRVSPVRPGTNFWDRLLYPTERAFSTASSVQKIEITYPTRETWPTHWLVSFLVLSIVAGLACIPFMKVQL